LLLILLTLRLRRWRILVLTALVALSRVRRGRVTTGIALVRTITAGVARVRRIGLAVTWRRRGRRITIARIDWIRRISWIRWISRRPEKTVDEEAGSNAAQDPRGYSTAIITAAVIVVVMSITISIMGITVTVAIAATGIPAATIIAAPASIAVAAASGIAVAAMAGIAAASITPSGNPRIAGSGTARVPTSATARPGESLGWDRQHRCKHSDQSQRISFLHFI